MNKKIITATLLISDGPVEHSYFIELLIARFDKESIAPLYLSDEYTGKRSVKSTGNLIRVS